MTANARPAPTVSLGLPVYNGAAYLEEAISSILHQTHSDFELIISDNGSTDDTERICRRHAEEDQRVTYHRQPVNHGASFNFRFVAERARAPLFKWATHDDVLEPRYLERCVAVLQSDPKVVLCHTTMAEIDEHGEITGHSPPRELAANPETRARFADVVLRAGETYHSLGVVRTPVLWRTPMLAPFASSDIPLLAELALYGRFHEIIEPLYRRREHPGQSTRAHPRARYRAAWFDPRFAGAITYPGWRMGYQYWTATQRAPLSPSDRRAARSVLGPWLWHYRDRLARELAWGVLEHGRRSRWGRRLAGQPPLSSGATAPCGEVGSNGGRKPTTEGSR